METDHLSAQQDILTYFLQLVNASLATMRFQRNRSQCIIQSKSATQKYISSSDKMSMLL